MKYKIDLSPHSCLTKLALDLCPLSAWNKVSHTNEGLFLFSIVGVATTKAQWRPIVLPWGATTGQARLKAPRASSTMGRHIV